MIPSKSLKPATRRAIPLFYISPAECMPPIPFSGSGTAGTVVLDIRPTNQKAGPSFLNADVIPGAVQLSWEGLSYAYSYVIYKATALAGPFDLVASNVFPTEFVDVNGVAGTFYRVTAIEPDAGETTPSPTVEAT